MPRSNKGDNFGCPDPYPLLCAEAEEANIAIDNGFILGEQALSIAKTWSVDYRFTPQPVCEFNRIAMHGIYECAGQYRTLFRGPPNFTPPHHSLVQELVEEMYSYANTCRNDPFHAAAFLLWRTNWIHPFYDGNGRTSRELCHLAILVETGDSWDARLPELLAEQKDRYITGLRAADKAWDGRFPPNVGELEALISELYIDHVIFPDDITP